MTLTDAPRSKIAYLIQALPITDNILIAFEINHSLKLKTDGKEGSMSIKLDMSKAFDKVEWSFLREMLLALGFHLDFVNLLYRCISTVSYSFLLNGQQFGHLKPQRGIRQGDPLSPYLFLICAEAFSCLLQEAERCGNISGVQAGADGPRISHFLFADDILLFGKATLREAQHIKSILQLYKYASGQEINLDKSAIVFSRNTSSEVRQSITNFLGIRETAAHDKYLGLPTVIGCSKRAVFSSIKDRIWRKIHGWNEQRLSRAGKEVLIKAVVQAIPTYSMSCFKFPDSLLGEIQSMISDFW